MTSLRMLQPETLRSISSDLGLSPSGTKSEMIEDLRGVTAANVEPTSEEDLVDMEMSSYLAVVDPPATQSPAPFDLSSLSFVVHLVTSSDGRYRERGEDNDDDDDFEEADEDDPWLKMYFVKIETTEGKRVGQFGYRVIHKSARRIDPYAVVQGNPPIVDTWNNLAQRLRFSERGGQDLEDFAYELWYNNPQHDPRDGGLREEFITGDRKGTGVFQRELNQGSLAFLSDDHRYAQDDFFINEEFRGRGVGRWALETLFKHETLRGVKFIFAEPWATRVNQRADDKASLKAAHDGVQLFFRKAGFRRVGQSVYFAYALADKKHPSRRLAIEDDADYKPSSTPFNAFAAMLGYH